MAQRKKIAKKEYKIWTVIEEHTVYTDGSDNYVDLRDEETASAGEFNNLKDARLRVELISRVFEGRIVNCADLDSQYIYGVDTHFPLKVPANVFNLLCEEELIQYDGRDWLYFEVYTEKIRAIQNEKGL